MKVLCSIAPSAFHLRPPKALLTLLSTEQFWDCLHLWGLHVSTATATATGAHRQHTWDSLTPTDILHFLAAAESEF